MAKIDKLTARQMLFIKHYLVHKNGARAARDAGYAIASADVEAARLLGNASIRRIIEEGLAQQYAELDLTPDLVLRRIREIAMDGRRDYVTASTLKMLGDHFGLFEPKRADDSQNREAHESRVQKALSEFEEDK